MISNICVISPGYPTLFDPVFPFVEQLCKEFARHGVKVTVIAPQSITHSVLHGKKIHPRYKMESINNEGSLEVFQPVTISVPAKYRRINKFFWYIAVKRIFRQIEKPDACYCHFWTSGFIAYKLLKTSSLPVFVATGESDIKNLIGGCRYDNKFRDYIKGVIAVSTKNKEESVSLNLTTSDKCIVLPNAIDNSLFRRTEKMAARKALGFSSNNFIVIFIGWFINRKGSQRLSKALDRFDDVYSIFIGEGNEEPNCNNILFKGRLAHNEIPLYLNASDIFVLPTLKEGCCNSIIEAMACGLPVVSSNLPFNWDVLNEKNSFMIDPMNVDEIADKIRILKDNMGLRNEMSKEVLETAKNLTISKRAERILNFMESRMQR